MNRRDLGIDYIISILDFLQVFILVLGGFFIIEGESFVGMIYFIYFWILLFIGSYLEEKLEESESE